MDPLTLAAIAAPFVAKGAEAFSKSAGEKLGAKVGELCQAVIDKFRGDSDAEETLALAQKRPDSKGRQNALEEVLAEKLEDDPDFASKVQRLVDELQKGCSSRTAFDQRGQKVIGPQINVAGDVNLPPPPQVLVPHLPAPPRDFTGRDEELKDLLADFDRGATITGLLGMGGIGKTALAYAMAEKLAGCYPDGQVLVELRGTSPEPMTPADAMAKVVRIYYPVAKLPESEAELARIYHSLLHDLRVLLLLDNAASREQVEPPLPPLSCAVIVTSRNRFFPAGIEAN